MTGPKTIFVIGQDLVIHKAETSEYNWLQKTFITYIGTEPILVSCGGWLYTCKYAGFETMKEAEDFKKEHTEQAVI